MPRHSLFSTKDLTVTMRYGYGLVQQVGSPRTAIVKPDVMPQAIVLRILSWHDDYDTAFEVLYDLIQEEEEEEPAPPLVTETRAISRFPWIVRRRKVRET